jgi:hypothetical protein
MIGWIAKLLCRHSWAYERDGLKRKYTCEKCGQIRTFEDLPVPKR